MTKILALTNDLDLTTRLTAILEVAGFELEFVQQANQISRLLRDGSIGALILDATAYQAAYRQIKHTSETANTPVLLLAEPDLLTDPNFELDVRDEALDSFFNEKDLLTGLVAVLQNYFKPVPNAAQREAQFHQVRHRLQQQFSRRADKSLRADHKHFSRIINRALR
jgi:DNA-binding response OmpR family regulator